MQVSPTVIKCKGKKPDCVTGAGDNLPAPQEAIITLTTYNEDGSPDETFRVTKLRVTTAAEDETTLTFERVE
ncbi:MAG: hypothetical protein ACKVTZ_05740 [Bacteroidia bacterium]